MRLALLTLAAAALVIGCDGDPETDAGARPRADGGPRPDGGVLPPEDGGVNPPRPVTLANLYDRLVDPVRLTHLPEPFHRTFQASSYDRASVTPGNDDWFANGDAGHFIRSEEHDGRTEFVMLDAAGPGALVRVWSATPMGTLRIYLDDDPEPVIAEDFDALMRGMVAPWDGPLAYTTAAQGGNLYFPIPYARRIVATTDQMGLYYHFNTLRFADGTEVEAFTSEAHDAAAASIDRARRILEDPGVFDDELQMLDETALSLSTMGDSATLNADPSGSQIRRIELHPSDLTEAALRATLLVIEFDGMETVRVPLGDFFGGGPGLPEHESLITEVRADGTLVVRWAMPFASSATIALEGEPDVSATGRVHTEARADDAPPMIYFFAGWRQNDGQSTRPHYDWTIADLAGRGQYVGTILNITNRDPIWWGEGDEKIFVDGETFPGYFGTGTEDYFGYAHTDPGYFARPFHGQPLAPIGPTNYGRTSNYRWHLLDPIPFREDFRFELEVWHWEDLPFPLDVISIWYATAETTHDDVPPMPAELVIPPL